MKSHGQNSVWYLSGLFPIVTFKSSLHDESLYVQLVLIFHILSPGIEYYFFHVHLRVPLENVNCVS